MKITKNISRLFGDLLDSATATAAALAALVIPLTAVWLPAPAQAANPVLPGYQADPTMNYFAGKYWIYTTAHEVNSYSSFHAYSSADMVNWVDEGEVLNSQNVSWAGTKDCWAPAVAFRNNKYYFYFSVDGSGSDSKIGVAVGTSPKGPFTDALGQALVYTKTTTPGTCEAIDPSVFIDDDGQAYLAYGGMWGWKPGIVKLNPDMISLNGSPVIFMSGFTSYTEGPCLTKRNGIYYLSYSSGKWYDGTYNVRYSTASSPLGPWTYRGQIMVSDTRRKGPGGHSFFQVPNTDTWKIVYHYWDPLMSARHTSIDSFGYNADGTIQPITMTGGGELRRWEAVNVPGSFIRHKNSRGRIDPNVSPLSDSRFLMVPGLRDSGNAASFSFESVNFPNYYLRHRNGEIWLDKYDGSALYEADATFYKRNGLSDSNERSFESFNYPGQYIRHVGSLLYRQSVSTATDKADATFNGIDITP